MIKAILTLLILCVVLCCSAALGNNDDLKVVKTIYDSENHCLIIPDSVFIQKADILLSTWQPSLDTIKKNVTGFNIEWSSINCIDGSLILRITKKQIYLKSSHENPNPNYLFWLVNITDEQYENIRKKINGDNTLFESIDTSGRYFYYKKHKVEKEVPNEWTEKERSRFDKHCEHVKYRNLYNLISFFNKGLPKDKKIPLVSEEDFDKIQAIRIASRIEEVEEIRMRRKRLKSSKK